MTRMKRFFRWKKTAILALTVWLTACGGYHFQQLDIQRSLANQQPERALKLLDAQGSNRRDKALYKLNKGMLLRYVGDYKGSNRFFESAKNKMQKLEATSLLENAGALSVNETLRSYAGQPYEKLMLHVYMAMNYLALGKKDEARVEMLQADVKIREWISAHKNNAMQTSAFARYLSGLIFEANGERDDALIAYRKAYEIYSGRNWTIPCILQKDLLRLTQSLALKDEYQQYKEQFDINDWIDHRYAGNTQQGELIYILNNGLITPLQEHITAIFNEDIRENIYIALPYYPPEILNTTDYDVFYRYVYIDDKPLKLELFEDLNWLAHENLAQRMPGLTLRAMTRAVLKKQVVDKVDEKHKLLGFITSVAGGITERADTRSWSTLPASISVARTYLSPGVYNISASSIGLPRVIEIKAGATTFLVDHAVASDTEITEQEP